VRAQVADQRFESFVANIHRRISIRDDERIEADSRAAFLRILLSRVTGAAVYMNGSIAHGDALTPLNDIDLGVVLRGVVAREEIERSPVKLMTRISLLIEEGGRLAYPDLSTTIAAQKRAILVDFGATQPAWMKFTADVIVALDYVGGAGLLVPNLHTEKWERSDPERHTEMIREINAVTGSAWNKTVRLAKMWNRQNGNPLSSWNIKALALNCREVGQTATTITSLLLFFRYALRVISAGPTPDPAGVSGVVYPELPRNQVVGLLTDAVCAIDQVVAEITHGKLQSAQKVFLDLLRLD
jgi:hypothetical protein